MSPEALRRSLQKMLTDSLIPLAVRAEQASVIFMEPLSLLRGGREITLHRGKALQENPQNCTRLYLNRWKNAGVHSIRYPVLAAVVEGEIDWRIGITESVRRRPDCTAKNSNYMVIPVRRGTFFFMPPGVAYSDGTGFHWDRPEAKKTAAVIFSLLILPSGFMGHFCRSTAKEHIFHRQIFLSSPQVHPLAKMLEEELRGKSEGAIVRGLLQTILGYAQRALGQELIVQPNKNNSALFASAENQDTAKNALDRAKNYIEMNLQEELNPDSIAKHAYLSARQLDRYFLREMGINIMEYVTNRRIETAKGLLRDTDLPVKQIGLLVGYQNPSSFAQVFKRHVRQSPGSFREE